MSGPGVAARLGLLAVACAVAAACARAVERAPVAADAGAPASREVAFAGCRHVHVGPVCEIVDDRGLRLWIADGPAVQVATDRGPLAPGAGKSVGGGTLYALVLPDRATWLDVRDEAVGQPRLHLPLREATPHPVLASARQLRAEGRADQAEQQLRASLDGLPAVERDRAGALLARLALARGQPDEAARGLRASMAAARAAGRLSEAIDDACALAFALAVHLQRFAEAREVVAGAEALAVAVPEGRARLPYYAAQVRANSGDIRGALRDFRLAAERAARLGMKRDEANARQEVAETMARLGRTAEALAQQHELIAAAPQAQATDPCLRAEPLIALSWYAILEHQAAAREGRARRAEDPSEDPSQDPAALLARARAALAGCTDSFSLQVALTNEALYALETGDLPAARARLRQLRRTPGARAQNLAAWEAEVDARLALAEGRGARALALFARQEEAARSTAYSDGIFRAQVGAGRALLLLGQTAAAARRYQQAEETLGAALLDVPLGEGKETFAGMRGESARQLVAALLDSGDAAGALRAARLARARLLAAASEPARIDELPAAERERWEALVSRYRQARRELEAQIAADRASPPATPGDREAARARRQRLQQQVGALVDDLHRVLEGTAADPRAIALRPPGDGELLVAYFPLDDGWVGLAATTARVWARRLGAVDIAAPPERLSAQLLAPFADDITAARALRLLPYGALERVDVHALPFRQATLLDQLPVAYGIDVARRGDAAGVPHDRALLVADPELNLPDTRVEVDAVRPLLAAGALAVQVLRGEEATRAAILAALPQARLFHFAGHGWFSGIDGIDSGLGVSQGGRIHLGDVMTLKGAPAVVVLSACEAGRAARGAPAAALPAGWGVAQAFLASGSQAVVAPVRPVLDRDALAFMRAFYLALGAGPSALAAGPSAPAASVGPQVSSALRSAQRRLRAEGGGAGAGSFRVLVP